jgi:hypothetical protein
MAVRTTITLEDDLNGSAADETVRFSLGATDYEIDLSAENASRFRAELAPFAERARKVGRGQLPRPGRSAATRRVSAEVRAWANENGLQISERGRIPSSIVQQYEAAMTGR